MKYYVEPEKQIPVRECDVVVAGGGTAGVIAAIAAARQGARTILVESKGYTGGVAVEGGTALHSFYNLWKAFPGVEKRQVVRGIPDEIIERLSGIQGGTSGHAEMERGFDYDSVNTSIDVELYKIVSTEMLVEAGVEIQFNTLVAGAVVEGSKVRAAITESRSRREAVFAKCFVDATGYGDLAAHAGAEFTEPNDHAVANSIGVGGVSLERYRDWLEEREGVGNLAYGVRDGEDNRLVRITSIGEGFPKELAEEARRIGMAGVVTSTHDDYFMFVKFNFKMPVSPTDRDEATKAAIQLRRHHAEGIELIRKWIPGCEKAFIARSSPSLAVRRGRMVVCDYDLPLDAIVNGIHFEDDIMSYGFHDCAPRIQIKDGGTYGIPYKALRVRGFDNLLAVGMMITSDWDAHMSTRNTVACMGQGQGAGTAAALCARKNCSTRALPYPELKEALLAERVYLEN